MKIKVIDQAKSKEISSIVERLTELDSKTFYKVILCAIKIRRGQKIIEKAVIKSKEVYV